MLKQHFIIVMASFIPLMAMFMPVHAAGNGWRLTWSDEFNAPDGSSPDPAKWSFDLGGGGWGNGELQYYTDRTQNVFHRNGCLIIRAVKENYEEWWEYTSGRIKTAGKFAQKYGRFEARIKIPYGQGIWPAFWLLGEDIDRVGWPACGEIDIMENIGKEPKTIHGTMHGPGYSGSFGLGASYVLPQGKVADDFHVFTLEWEPGALRWYFDDVLYQTRTSAEMVNNMQWIFDHPFFIILNVAVGGYWPGKPDETTGFPQEMAVDYVRVYERSLKER
ncbi:MAG: glycoside hydrolase family 16 protein [Firmicutes bacterium]|nr:glycoside hydrolase family 16 protein [Bacillota bacterium]